MRHALRGEGAVEVQEGASRKDEEGPDILPLGMKPKTC